MSDVKKYARVSEVLACFQLSEVTDYVRGLMAAKADRSRGLHALLSAAITMDRLHVDDFLAGVDDLETCAYVRQYLEWHGEASVLETETRHSNDELFVTGQPDAVLSREGRIVLIDWKMKYKLSYRDVIQSAAYCDLVDYNIDERYLIQFHKGAMTVKRIESDLADDVKRWHTMLATWKRLKELDKEINK